MLGYPSVLNSYSHYLHLKRINAKCNFPEFIHVFQSETFLMDLLSKKKLFGDFLPLDLRKTGSEKSFQCEGNHI